MLELLGRDVDGTCLVARTVAGEGSFQGGEGTWAEAVGEALGDLRKLTMGCVLEMWVLGSEERM